MSDGASLSFDFGQIDRDADRLVRRYLSAGTEAVSGTTKRLERDLEATTQRAVPGNLWRAWASQAFPKKGPAKNPVGTVFLNGGSRTRGAMAFWTQPGEIRNKGGAGTYLAIPLPAAGPRGKTRNLTPEEWQRAHPGVRLQFVYRQGKPSLLVAVGGTTNARAGGFRKLTRGRVGQGRSGANPLDTAAVPIFLLLPMVRFRNAFAIEPIVRQAERDLPGAFVDALGKII